MIKNKVSFQMIKYELRNVAGNPFVHIFGIGFPILLSILISQSIISEVVYSSYVKEVVTTVFLGIGTIIPMATILMGYSSTCAQDIEKEIPQRMQLFGFSEKYTMINRLLAEIIYMLLAFILYFIVGITVLKIKPPVISGAIIYALCIFLLAGILFAIAHAVANIVKKFGLTYLICMISYFAMMILSGMMGIAVNKLPKGIQVISKLLPTTYFNQDFYKVWMGQKYDFVPLIQSYIFLIAIAGILTFVMFFKSRRKLH